MSPRGRTLSKRGLPPNLYERRGYYSWRHPKTREEFGLGTDKASAVVQAVEANIKIARLTHVPRLVDRIDGSHVRSVEAWANEYADYLAKLELADNTRRAYASFNRRVVAMLGGNTLVKAVTALQVSNALSAIVAEGKARTAQAFRHYMRDWFREAIVQGWRDENPVRDTKLAVTVEVKRARLALDVFRGVYAIARPWLRNAMALAMVSAQRREDVSCARFADFHDGGWWLIQQSEKATTPHRIFVPGDLRLDAFGMSLDEVVSQCRRSGVLSPFLVHQTEPRGNSPVGSQIWIDTISRRFSETLARLKLDFGEKTPPTFHEIRSLSERLYRDQGGVATQHLLGHADAETTEMYNDSRGSEWTHALDGKKVVSE
jgi:integrase